jgi:hypothetical protein
VTRIALSVEVESVGSPFNCHSRISIGLPKVMDKEKKEKEQRISSIFGCSSHFSIIF